MGTNYYAQIRNHPDPIHVGKSNVGWRFIFRCYKESPEGPGNIGEWTAFLSRADVSISDGYGQPVSLSDFWMMVEYKQNLKADESASVVGEGIADVLFQEFS